MIYCAILKRIWKPASSISFFKSSLETQLRTVDKPPGPFHHMYFRSRTCSNGTGPGQQTREIFHKLFARNLTQKPWEILQNISCSIYAPRQLPKGWCGKCHIHLCKFSTYSVNNYILKTGNRENYILHCPDVAHCHGTHNAADVLLPQPKMHI